MQNIPDIVINISNNNIEKVKKDLENNITLKNIHLKFNKSNHTNEIALYCIDYVLNNYKNLDILILESLNNFNFNTIINKDNLKSLIIYNYVDILDLDQFKNFKNLKNLYIYLYSQKNTNKIKLTSILNSIEYIKFDGIIRFKKGYSKSSTHFPNAKLIYITLTQNKLPNYTLFPLIKNNIIFNKYKCSIKDIKNIINKNINISKSIPDFFNYKFYKNAEVTLYKTRSIIFDYTEIIDNTNIFKIYNDIINIILSYKDINNFNIKTFNIKTFDLFNDKNITEFLIDNNLKIVLIGKSIIKNNNIYNFIIKLIEFEKYNKEFKYFSEIGNISNIKEFYLITVLIEQLIKYPKYEFLIKAYNSNKNLLKSTLNI